MFRHSTFTVYLQQHLETRKSQLILLKQKVEPFLFLNKLIDDALTDVVAKISCQDHEVRCLTPLEINSSNPGPFKSVTKNSSARQTILSGNFSLPSQSDSSSSVCILIIVLFFSFFRSIIH